MMPFMDFKDYWLINEYICLSCANICIFVCVYVNNNQ